MASGDCKAISSLDSHAEAAGLDPGALLPQSTTSCLWLDVTLAHGKPMRRDAN